MFPISSILKVVSASTICLAFFLKAFPIAALFGTASMTSTTFGSVNFLSAANRIPVALECCDKSYADRSAHPTHSIQP